MKNAEIKVELLKIIKKYKTDYWKESNCTHSKVSKEDSDLIDKHNNILADNIIELFDK